jgi:hypothetical protein
LDIKILGFWDVRICFAAACGGLGLLSIVNLEDYFKSCEATEAI